MSIFKDNKYTKIYYQLINRCICRVLNRSIYTERHHIIPKSMGGLNGNNIVRLLPREHFICHLLLPKMVISQKDINKMNLALLFMSHKNDNNQRYNPPSKQYENFRLICSTIPRRKSYVVSIETRNKLSKTLKRIGHKPPIQRKIDGHIDFKLGKTYEEIFGLEKALEKREKMRKAMTGKVRSKESSEKKRLAMLKIWDTKRKAKETPAFV